MSDLRLGDCRAVMAGMEPNSVDAIVTDPPYGLEFMGKEWDRLTGEPTHWNDWQAESGRYHNDTNFLANGNRPRYGKNTSAMQGWHESWAREAYRVLRPGGHLLAFGGTRTFHRLACALEDAGFEIRDVLSWLYGSGFPKSLDVSKALDKRRDDRADVLRVTRWTNAAIKAAGVSFGAILQHFGFNDGSGQIGHWAALSLGAQPAVPTWGQWLRLKDLLGCGDEMDNEVWRLNGRKGQPGEAWHEREVVGASRGKTKIGGADGATPWSVGAKQATVAVPVTAPATDLAAQWAGWGTALKPAYEPIVLCRKPLIGTVAANVAAHGTGGLNVDGCRIASDGPHGTAGRRVFDGFACGDGGFLAGMNTEKSPPHPSGRWPANVVLGCCGHDPHDPECAVRLLDEQSGERRTGGGNKRNTHPNQFRARIQHRGEHPDYSADTGGASRFFLNVPADNEWYACDDCGIVRHIAELTSGCPQCGETMVPYRLPIDDPETLRFKYQSKASRAERNAGLDGMPVAESVPDYKGKMADWQKERGRNPDAYTPQANHHPTVKPIALMRWLCRLICPPNGTILDPFLGSGSTGCAAALEGFAFIGIEAEPDYLSIAEARIRHWTAQACCRTQQLELAAD